MLISKLVSWGLIWKSLADRVNKVFLKKSLYFTWQDQAWLPVCTSSVKERCGSVRPAAPSALHPTVQSRTCNKEGRSSPLCVFVNMMSTSMVLRFYPHKRELEAFYVGGRSRVSANGSDTRRQQVIDEDDVVLWHNRFPLCPCWGWGLLFVRL